MERRAAVPVARLVLLLSCAPRRRVTTLIERLLLFVQSSSLDDRFRATADRPWQPILQFRCEKAADANRCPGVELPVSARIASVTPLASVVRDAIRPQL